MIHGVLMTIAWFVFHFIGVFVGRRISIHGKKMLYTHIGLQLAGLVFGTASLIICFQKFGIPYEYVAYRHGELGIAVMALSYFQALVGFVRPKRESGQEFKAQTLLRKGFEILHPTFGIITTVLGFVNCITGIYIL